MPVSSRCTNAPSDRKSRAPVFGIFKWLVMISLSGSLSGSAGPVRVKHSVAVGPPERVRAEEVPLTLRKVCGKPRAAIRVVVRKRRAGGRHRYAERDGALHEYAPRLLARIEGRGKRRIDHQIDETRTTIAGRANIGQQLRADDAAGPPDLCDVARVDVVLIFLRCEPQQRHALGVRRHFAGV